MTKRHRSLVKALLIAGSASIALGSAAFAQEGKALRFDIPAENLGAALTQVARTSQHEIVFNADLLRGRSAPAIRGEMTISEALDRLLQGTGLSHRITATGSIVVEASNSAASSGGSNEVADIIVTATKRSEVARKISGSVTPLTGARLDQIGASSMSEYLAFSPGVVFDQSYAGDSAVSIRGVSTNTFFDQGQGTTAYYINDIPLTDPFYTVAIPDIDTFDVDNVSILRGPQGTLFGSGSLGGAIDYQTTKPNLSKYQARIQGTLNSAEGGGSGGSAKAMINVPLISDTLAVRAVMTTRKDPGFIDNIGTHRSDSNVVDTFGGRVEVEWTPSAKTTVNYLFLDQTTKTDDWSYVMPVVAGPLRKTSLIPEPFRFNTEIHSLRLDQNLGFATFTAMASYHKKTQSETIDITPYVFGAGASYTLANLISSTQSGPSAGTTFEARLASPTSNSFEYIVGVMRDDTRQNLTNTTVAPAPFQPLFPTTTSPFRGQETAAFGEATFHLNEAWKVILGGRAFETETDSTKTGSASGHTEESGFLPKASLTWAPNQDFLAYGLVSEGFRYGGPNLNANLSTPANPIPASYGSDSLTNYEAGVRTNLFSRSVQLDATVFYIDWRNIQLRQATPNGLHTYATNAGDATNYGFEGSTTWRPIRGLVLSGNLTYLRAYLNDDYNDPSPKGLVRAGTTLPGAAKWQLGDTASYQWSNVPLQPTLLLTHRYISSSPGTLNSNFVLNDYNLFSARVTAHFKSFDVSAFVNNIGDSHAVVNAQQAWTLEQYIVTPRVIGITIDYKI